MLVWWRQLDGLNKSSEAQVDIEELFKYLIKQQQLMTAY